MINALKKNPALYIGLALPLLMLLFFAGVPFISSLVVEAPKYNFIYSITSYQVEGKLRVVDGKLELDAYNRDNHPKEPPPVYLIDVHSKKNTKLNFVLPNEDRLLIPPYEHRTFIVEGISLKNLDTSMIAPDGYQFTSDNHQNLDIFPFFFGGNRSNSLSISKSGRIERFQMPREIYWNPTFEGWVIPSQ